MKKLIALTFIFIIGLSLISAQNRAPIQKNWYKEYNDSLQGINLKEATTFIQHKKLKPRKQIVVGVIDSGIDTLCIDLIPALWHNPKEKKDGKDNDKNGYVDDLHGWNFLGTKDGSFNLLSAGTEEFREFKRLYPKYKSVEEKETSDNEEYNYYIKMRTKAGIRSYLKFANYASTKEMAYQQMDSIITHTPNVNIDTLTLRGLTNLSIENEDWNRDCQIILVDIMKSDENTTWKELRQKHSNELNLIRSRLNSIEHTPDKRLLMGDNMKDASDLFYGNAILKTEECDHGNFVAALIAGQGTCNAEMKGVWPQAKLMIIRAVANGDEYDKDVATSIRYAVDNGAKVINMSLGKYTSPDAPMVSEAIAYAQKKDVLIIQAAGNNKRNIDEIEYFPTAKNKSGERFSNYIRVGASTKKGEACSFSNYGAQEVDLFAPGEEIVSVFSSNRYEASQGTSVAAPIVSGIAAMLRAYFPKLKAHQIKDILQRSVRTNDELKSKCITGGVIDVLKAVKLAIEY